MNVLTKAFAVPAILAAFSVSAAPAAAAALAVAPAHSPVEATSHYGPYGYGYRDYRHRGRGDAGGILAGVLILGGIAAVASAASRDAQRNRSYPYPQRYPSYPQQNYRTPNGIDGAVNMCVREVERSARIGQVDRAERTSGGWLIAGSMADGAAFSCSIGRDGRIDHLDVGGRAAPYGVNDSQYDDDTYRSARADTDRAPPAAEDGPLPAYPGGPLPGESPDDAAPDSNPGA